MRFPSERGEWVENAKNELSWLVEDRTIASANFHSSD